MFFFFFNDTATPEIYPLSLHDALPISVTDPAAPPERCWLDLPEGTGFGLDNLPLGVFSTAGGRPRTGVRIGRSEEHTSELQSRQYLVCRLLLEKKKHTISTLRYRYYLR